MPIDTKSTSKTSEPQALAPIARYEAGVQSGELSRDPDQVRFVEKLDLLRTRLLASPPVAQKSRFGRWFAKPQPESGVRGIYVWGGVGRGKTLMMDLFYQSIPFAQKRRNHFHDFMTHTQDALKLLNNQQDPLAVVANRYAAEFRLLCFDEFHVSDIADAMILGRLFRALFDKGVTLVATSNIEPDGLYAGGLQRAQFLPAIELIKHNCEVIHLQSAQDYRLRALERAPVYHAPADAGAQAVMATFFADLVPDQPASPGEVEIAGRGIKTLGAAHGVVWFEFDQLCDTPRAASDYMEIARLYHTVLLSNVPVLDDMRRDASLRLIHLVDSLYDHNVNLIVSAETEPQYLYTGTRHEAAFRRTRSRLEEMRSHEYLAREHLP